jgi:hypothetical protein
MDQVEAFAHLGVPEDVSREDIEAAWRTAMRATHPDVTLEESDGRRAAILNEARDIALRHVASRSTELVLIREASAAIAQAQQQVAGAAKASENAMKQVVLHHVGLLSLRKRRNAVIGAISGAFGVVSAAIGTILGPGDTYTGPFATALLSLGGLCVVGGMAFGLAALGLSTREKLLEDELTDAENTLSDRGDLAQTLDQLSLEDFFTRKMVYDAIDHWSSPDEESGVSAGLGAAVFGGSDGYQPVPLPSTARRIGSVDFARLLLTKGMEFGLLREAEEGMPDGSTRHGSRRIVAVNP